MKVTIAEKKKKNSLNSHPFLIITTHNSDNTPGQPMALCQYSRIDVGATLAQPNVLLVEISLTLISF